MPKQNPLLNIVKKQKEGKAVAIYSCCSSNAFVIEAREFDTPFHN